MSLIAWLLVLAFCAVAFFAARTVRGLLKPSSTAEGVALFRFYDHLQSANRPAHLKTFPTDSWAQYMIHPRYHIFKNQWIRRVVQLVMNRRAGLDDLIGLVIGRTRFIDTHILRTLEAESDFRQLVILGAGYDCRAYRLAAQLRLHQITAFEVDLPHLQKIKREKVLAAVQEIQRTQGETADLSHVRYVATDFNMDALPSVLQEEHGFKKQLKSIVLFEGVTGYLTADAVEATFRFLHQNTAPGSVLIGTFPTLPHALVQLMRSDPQRYRELLKDPKGLSVLSGVTEAMAGKLHRLAQMGEPIQSSMSPEELPVFFDVQHFDVIELSGREEIQREYLGPGEGQVRSGYYIAVLRNRS